MTRTILERIEPREDAYDRISFVSEEPQSITVHDLAEGTSKIVEQYVCRSEIAFAPVVSLPAEILETHYNVIQEGDLDEEVDWTSLGITTTENDRAYAAMMRALLDLDEEEDDDA